MKTDRASSVLSLIALASIFSAADAHAWGGTRITQVASSGGGYVVVNGCRYEGHSVTQINGRTWVDGVEVRDCHGVDGARGADGADSVSGSSSDPCGPGIPVHRHANADGSEGGWVSDRDARVAASVYVGHDVRVCGGNFSGEGRILDHVTITGSPTASGRYVFRNSVTYSGSGLIDGSAGEVVIHDSATISGRVNAHGPASIGGSATISGDLSIGGGSSVSGSSIISGHASLSGGSSIGGNAIISGNVVLQNGASISGDAIVSGNLNLDARSVSGGVYSN